jgi:hypothetical protein
MLILETGKKRRILTKWEKTNGGGNAPGTSLKSSLNGETLQNSKRFREDNKTLKVMTLSKLQERPSIRISSPSL